MSQISKAGRDFSTIKAETGGLSVEGTSIKFNINNKNGDRPLTFGIIPRMGGDAMYPFTMDMSEDAVQEALSAGQSLNLVPGTYTMPKAEVGDPTKTCVVTDLGDKGLGFLGIRGILAFGAAFQLTFGKVREVVAGGASPSGQVEQPFYEVVSKELQSVRKKVNVTVLKGQELDKDTVLGPFKFGENFVVGGNIRGLEYTVLPGTEVIVELWYTNLFTMADFLGKYVTNISASATE